MALNFFSFAKQRLDLDLFLTVVSAHVRPEAGNFLAHITHTSTAPLPNKKA